MAIPGKTVFGEFKGSIQTSPAFKSVCGNKRGKGESTYLRNDEIQSTLKGTNRFGRVKDDHLILRGRILAGALTKNKADQWRVPFNGELDRILPFDTLEDEADMAHEK
jgi:hypothetical protein